MASAIIGIQSRPKTTKNIADSSLMEKTEDPVEFASRLCFPADPGTPAVQNARGRSGTFDNSRCNHVIIARENIAVGPLAGSWISTLDRPCG